MTVPSLLLSGSHLVIGRILWANRYPLMACWSSAGQLLVNCWSTVLTVTEQLCFVLSEAPPIADCFNFDENDKTTPLSVSAKICLVPLQHDGPFDSVVC